MSICAAREMSVRDYAQFRERLGREFPGEQFLLVRFGDHQPHFAKYFMEPGLDRTAVAQRILERDPLFHHLLRDRRRQLPAGRPVVRATLDAPYLPLVVLEGAGCRSTPRLRSRRRFSTVAAACSTSAPAAPRPAASTAC